jgi:hypothetical protein
MDLMPDEIRRHLIANGAAPDGDHGPVVNFLDPTGAAIWRITEMDPAAPDVLFGLCDLGLGCPELGCVRLSELRSVAGRFGLGIARDRHVRARHPLSVHARAAQAAGAVAEDPARRAAAASTP